MIKNSKWKKISAIVLVWCMVAGLVPANVFAETRSGVVLYTNGTVTGEYDTINEAFDKMTDEQAEYEVQLKDSQNLTGYASWPKVKSITIGVYDPEGNSYGAAVLLRLEQLNTNLQSEVHFKDSIQLSYMYTNKIADFNLQGYDLYVDYTDAGWVTSFVNLNIKDEIGSEVILNGNSQLVNGSLSVLTVRSNSVYNDYGYSTGYMTFSLAEGTHSYIQNFYGENLLKIKIDGGTKNAPMIIENIYSENPYLPGEQDGMVAIESPHEFQISIGNIYALRTTMGINCYEMEQNDVKIWGNVTGTVYVTYTEDLTQPVREGKLPNKESVEQPLFYAPKLKDGQVKLSYTTGCHYNERSFYPYDYSGILYSEDGYYIANNIPGVYLDKAFCMIGDRAEVQVSYELENREDIESVKWEITYQNISAADSQAKLTWDEKTVTANIMTFFRNKEYMLLMTATYKDGSVIHVGIPVYMTTWLKTPFTLDKTSVHFDSYTELSTETLNFTYKSNWLPSVMETTTDSKIVSLVGEDKKKRNFKVTGCGKATITVYVGDEVQQCEVTVDMPVSKKRVWVTPGSENSLKYEPYYVTEIPGELDGAVIECMDQTIAKAEHTGWGTVKVTGLKKGETTLKITYRDYVKEIPVVVGEVILGDVNGDTKIDASDALAILKYVAKMEPESFISTVADCDGNENIDASDALMILKYVAKMIDL